VTGCLDGGACGGVGAGVAGLDYGSSSDLLSATELCPCTTARADGRTVND
jgi:hypothetical protein